MARNIHLHELSEIEARNMVVSGLGAIRGVSAHDQRLAYFSKAYSDCIRLNLRVDPVSNVMRDNNGWLSRPSNPRDAELYTREEALFYLAREVWCDAVRLYNIERM